MTANDDLATVIRLACLTEERSDAEQRALVNLAWRCDVAHNQHTGPAISRRDDKWEPSDLVGLVLATRVLGDGDSDIPPPKTWQRRWSTWESEGAMSR